MSKTVTIEPGTVLDEATETVSKNLSIVLSAQSKLRYKKETDIKFTAPILKQNDNPVFYPNTINVVQGQNGSHKSRLVENICSAIMKLNGCDKQLLGFKRTEFNAIHTVVYIDTERNLSEQLPYALQSIQIGAGYEKKEHPTNFEYTSLLQIARKDRFTALNEYLKHLRENTSNPLFIVLDVSTDCIEDFNKVDKSMELIDLLNVAINEYEVTFVCIIHENPNSDKARGHFGTELMNKASTAMQVRFEKDANQNDSDIIRVKYLKCRSTAKHAPFYIKYCNEAKGLVLADVSEVSGIVNSRKHKASNEDIIEFLEMYLGDGTTLTRVELLDKLCKDFKASQRTVETRVTEILNSESEITDEKGQICTLVKELKEKTIYYKLKPRETL